MPISVWLRRLEWLCVALGAVLLVGAALGTWALRTGRAARFLEARLVQELDNACGLKLSFEHFEVEPLSASLRVRGLKIQEDSGLTALSVQEAFADLSLLPLLRGRVEVAEVTLEQPSAEVRVEAGKVLGIPRCITHRRKTARSGFPLGIEVIEVRSGAFEFLVDEQVIELDGVSVVLWPGPYGGSEITLRVQSGKLAPDLEVKKLQLLGHLEGALTAPRALRLKQLQVSIGGFMVDAGGNIDFLGPVYNLELTTQGPLEVLNYLPFDGPEIGGQLQLFVKADGIGLEPSATVSLELLNGHIGHRTLGQKFELQADIDRTGVQLNNVDITVADGQFSAQGRIDFDAKRSLQLEAQARNFSFARLMDALGEKGVWADFAVTGPTRVKGSLNPVRIEGPFNFDVHGVDVWNHSWDDPRAQAPRSPTRMLDVVPVHISGRWIFTRRRMEILKARLSSERSRGVASAVIQYQSPKRVEIHTELEHLSFSDLGNISGVSLLGEGPVSGWLGGPFTDLSAVGAVDLEGVSIAGVPLGAASAEVRWDGQHVLDVDAIEGRLGLTRWIGGVKARFVGAVPVRVKGEITRGRLGDLLLPMGASPAQAAYLDGDIRGAFDLRGPVSRWRGRLNIEGDDLSIVSEKFKSGRARGRMVKGELVVDELQLHKKNGWIVADGWVNPKDQNFKLNMQSESLRIHDIDTLQALLPGVDGALRIESTLGGRVLRPTGNAKLYLEEVTAAGSQFGNGLLEATFKPQYVTVSGSMSGLGTKIDTQVWWSSNYPYSAKLKLNKAPAPDALGVLLGIPAQGSASLNADIKGLLFDPNRSSGSVHIEELRTAALGTTFKVLTPLDLQLNNGQLDLGQLRIVGRHLTLDARGVLGLENVGVELKGQLDLGVLSQWVPSIERSGGRLQFTGDLTRGAQRDLALVGVGRLEDGRLEWRGIPHRLTGIRGELTFTQSSLLVDSLKGRWAGGALTLGGSVLFEDPWAPQVDFAMDVERARAKMPMAWTDLAGQLDGHMAIKGTWPRLRVEGDVEVRNGRATPRTDISQIIGARAVPAAIDPSAEVLELDIHLPLIDPLRVRNDDVDVSVSGELRLTGTNERLGLLGTMVLERGGRVTFVGREYLTESGLIEMRERYQLATRYDLSVSTSACDARIFLSLVGNLESVQTSYSSNPEMDRQDIVSCLIRGVKGRDLDQDLASFAGSALLKLSGVDRQVKRVIPLDQIDVTTEFSSRARAYEPRVLMAKDLSLISRPARLEYSTSLLRNDDQRAAFRIRLTPLLSLQLGWTSSDDVPIGDWGLDLKRSWEW